MHNTISIFTSLAAELYVFSSFRTIIAQNACSNRDYFGPAITVHNAQLQAFGGSDWTVITSVGVYCLCWHYWVVATGAAGTAMAVPLFSVTGPTSVSGHLVHYKRLVDNFLDDGAQV